jgi:hypothetical protein
MEELPEETDTEASIKEADFVESLVAFVDILGFKNRVLNSTDSKSLISVVDDLKTIQNKFDFKSTDPDTVEVQNILHKEVLAFSDSLVVSIGYDAEGYSIHGGFDFLLPEIINIARAQAECVSQDIFLRGGVADGLWYYRDDCMVSPALISAYGIEGEIWAPVIGISQELYKKFAEHSDRKTYAPGSDPFLSEVRRFNKGGKDFWFIDYVRIYLGELEDANEEVLWLQAHARAIQKGYDASPNEDIREKYRWLASYHNEVARDYTVWGVRLLVLPGRLYKTYPPEEMT